MMHHYLDKMGITVWQLRQNNAHKQYGRIKLMDMNNNLIGMIIADFDFAASQPDQENLLRKIGDILSAHSQYEMILPISVSEDEKKTAQFYILLGEHAQKIICTGRVIQSYSLVDLINNPEYKKQLWKQIKSLRDLFL